MKDIGYIHYFLGIQVQFHSSDLLLNQTKYAEDILYQVGSPPITICLLICRCSLTQTPNGSNQFSNPTYFTSLARKLQYLTWTRHDIQFVVNFVCQRMHSPTVADFAVLKRILHYIKDTTTLGLHLINSSNLQVLAYSDNDWVGCKETRRLTNGFCTYLWSNLVSRFAKRQPTVSSSSTEAEYCDLAETAAELTWISSQLRDLQVYQSNPAILHLDNLSAVYLSTNTRYTLGQSRSKWTAITFMNE